jgi:hypothetical protein
VEAFSSPETVGEAKPASSQCRACGTRISAQAGRLQSHWDDCPSRERSIGQPDSKYKPPPDKKAKSATTIPSAASPSKRASRSQAASPSTFDRDRQHFDILTPAEHNELTEMFGAAIRRTATPFQAFEHPAWKEFFGKLRGAFKIPTTEVIGNDLQQIEYKNIMAEVV